jgi:integrase
MTKPPARKRPANTGSIVKLKYRDKATGKLIESRFWYILYRTNSGQVRESSKSEVWKDADDLLRLRMAEAGLGQQPRQNLKGIKYEDIREAYIAKAREDGVKFFTKEDGTEYLRGVPNLDAFFKGKRLVNIDESDLTRYKESRRKEHAADPTIRRELVTLRAMWKRNKKARGIMPDFEMPADSKARTGFVDPDVFAKLFAALPEHLRPLIKFLYHTGCRVGAAKLITWDMVNPDATEIVLPGEITKNGEPLPLPLVGKGLNEISAMLKKMFRKDGPVFEPTNLRKEWASACHNLGLGVKAGWTYRGLTLHDLRRSAIRNLVRAGVREDVAMSISGHKTRATFSRYNITDSTDVRDALIKVGEYNDKMERAGRKRIAQMPKAAKGKR